jgi:hypothetical protein
MLSKMAYSTQNIINFNGKVSNLYHLAFNQGVQKIGDESYMSPFDVEF